MGYKAHSIGPADASWGSPATSLLPVKLCWVRVCSWTRNSEFGYTGQGENATAKLKCVMTATREDCDYNTCTVPAVLVAQ